MEILFGRTGREGAVEFFQEVMSTASVQRDPTQTARWIVGEVFSLMNRSVLMHGVSGPLSHKAADMCARLTTA